MGVTKQAARKRFIPKAVGSPGDADADDGFARFTQRARNVVVAAHNEAVSAGSAENTSAHLVLGLLTDPEAIAGVVLTANAVSPVELRARATQPPPTPPPEPPHLVPPRHD